LPVLVMVAAFSRFYRRGNAAVAPYMDLVAGM
jgi:hypothetical protein